MHSRLSSSENRDLSPYTGWTHDHWQEIMTILIRGFFNFVTPGGAGIIYPGSHESVWGKRTERMEGFTRSFFLTAPFLRHSDDGILEDETLKLDVGEFYRRGVVHGTDKSHPEYWGGIHSFNQTIVESAALALNLYFSRKLVWDTLSLSEQKQTARYLLAVARCRTYHNNWMLFRALIYAVLKSFGMPYDEAIMNRLARKSADLYVANGWYTDGRERCFDYYNAWVIHPYLLFWCDINPETDPAFFRMCKERMNLFTSHLKHFFSGDGSYPAFGRSLIYRFGVVSAFSAAEYFSCSSLTPGEARRICSGNLKYFWERGAMNGDGYFSLGYHSELPGLAEYYSSPQSPLWAAKAWWSFLLTRDHPFWTFSEEPMPVEKGDYSRTIDGTGMIVMGNKASGQVLLNSVNQNSFIEKKYSNLYTLSQFGMLVIRNGKLLPFDNAVCSENIRGQHDLGLARSELIVSGERFSIFARRLGDVWPTRVVYTCLIFKGDTVVRIHVTDFRKPGRFFEGGVALAYDDKDLHVEQVNNGLSLCNEKQQVVFRKVSGWDSDMQVMKWNHSPSGNSINGHHAAYPYLSTGETVKGRRIFISSCTTRSFKEPVEDIGSFVRMTSCEDGVLEISFGDGEMVIVQPVEVRNIDRKIDEETVKGPVRFARFSPGRDLYVVEDKPGPPEGPPVSFQSVFLDWLVFRVFSVFIRFGRKFLGRNAM